jgi:spectrin beta
MFTSRSWERVCVVLRGGHVGFYKDNKAYRNAPEATYKGEPPVELAGARADVAADYTKKKHVFRLK